MGFFTYAKYIASLTVALRVIDGRSKTCTSNHLEKSPEVQKFNWPCEVLDIPNDLNDVSSINVFLYRVPLPRNGKTLNIIESGYNVVKG
jgi:hypothetical protein